MTGAAAEYFEERAAIRQWDGGADLEDAEALAIGDVAITYGWPAAVELAQGGENAGQASQP